jgi:hypothetical protein
MTQCQNEPRSTHVEDIQSRLLEMIRALNLEVHSAQQAQEPSTPGAAGCT